MCVCLAPLDAEGQRECESRGALAPSVCASKGAGESLVFDRLVARWFSACGLQRVRPQPASLLLISAGPVFFEWRFSGIGFKCV